MEATKQEALNLCKKIEKISELADYTLTISHYISCLSDIKFNNLGFETVEDFCKTSKLTAITSGFRIKSLAASTSDKLREYVRDNLTLQLSFKSVSAKLTPVHTPVIYRPYAIYENPYEITEGEHTYRILTANINYDKGVGLVVREDESLYDYLDKGYWVLSVGDKHIVSDVYDLDTAHIFMMCKIDPDLCNLLTRGCFINSREASLLRVRLLKKMNPLSKESYLLSAETIDQDYQENTTMVALDKVINGSSESTTINDVRFTAHTASYGNIVVERPNLLVSLKKLVNFNSEFDIYTICEKLGNHIQDCLVNNNKDSFTEVTINSIPIQVELFPAGARRINNFRVKRDEVALAVRRAACYHSREDYELFLASVSRVSMRMHDVLANGLGMKIHENITDEEYANEQANHNAPALRFITKGSKYYIKIDEHREAEVKLAPLISRVDAVNAQTNNQRYSQQGRRISYGYNYTRRDYLWAREKVIEALIDCCTFYKKKTTRYSLVRQDIPTLFADIEITKNEALERSKLFLETAIKLTGAERIVFKGEEALKVTGSLRSYAVLLSNAKVYDFESKKYRCIVNSNHYTGRGYDDVAARILALKNDSVLQAKIATLQGEAQPQYEQHNNYNPERGGLLALDRLPNLQEAV